MIAYPKQQGGSRDDPTTFIETVRWKGSIGGPQTMPKAELAAVVELLDRTNGDVTILSDCVYVVGFCRKGFGRTARSNRDLWARTQARLRQRPGKVVVEKVAAHTSSEDVNRGLIRCTDRYLNGVADRLAGEGAQTAALPPGIAQNVADVRNLLHAIQDRLLIICGDAFARRASSDERQAALAEVLREPRPPRPPLHQRLAAAAKASTHDVRLNRWEQRIVCTGCLRRSRPEVALRWLSQPCPAVNRPRPGGGIHPSHRLFVAGQSTKLVACKRCACYAVQKTQRLRFPCRGYLSPTGGKNRLKRLVQGLLPQGKGSLGARAGCHELVPPAKRQRLGEAAPQTASERLAAVRARVQLRARAAA